jgi:bacillithiol system protein YtxJ
MIEILEEIQTLEGLNEAIKSSGDRPVLIFKHSLTCPISARAYREFKSYLAIANPAAIYRLIVVQNARPVSDEAARRLGIDHESPQALLVRGSREIWNASHFEITASSLASAIEAALEPAAPVK